MAGINRSGTASTAPQGQSEGRSGKGQGLLGMRYKKSDSNGGWEPTTLYLILLVIVEITIYGVARYSLKGVHGG